MPKTRVIKWPHVTAVCMLKYGLWGRQVVTPRYDAMVAITRETNERGRRCCWLHFIANCVWLDLVGWLMYCKMLISSKRFLWHEHLCFAISSHERKITGHKNVSYKDTRVTPADKPMGSLIIRYTNFRTIELPCHLPHSFPNLYIIEWYCEVEINAIFWRITLTNSQS
jgi:hypothetical protein